MRLDRFICKSTLLSKVEAVHAISHHHVTVNGDVIDQADHQVHENNHIELNGDVLTLRPFRYLLMHKPAGYICSNRDETYPSLFNRIDIAHASELHIVGRLDVDTTGLVLITDDGRWSFGITRPEYDCPKTYRVGLSKPVTEDQLRPLKQGVSLQGERLPAKPADAVITGEKEILLTITEGKFHQVKRMMAAIGNRVRSLHREQIGHLTLDCAEGEWRYLTPEEIKHFG